jgi:hypothetical protein
MTSEKKEPKQLNALEELDVMLRAVSARRSAEVLAEVVDLIALQIIGRTSR